jgi:hypothetical protein
MIDAAVNVDMQACMATRTRLVTFYKSKKCQLEIDDCEVKAVTIQVA